jgi:outer membrane protein
MRCATDRLTKRNVMKRVLVTGLLLPLFASSAQSKDLIGVFEDAVHNDPVILQADANRLAAREAKPQAIASLLPQLSGSAGVTGDHNSGTQPLNTINANNAVVLVAAPATVNTTTRTWSVNLKQNVFSWANWMTLKEAGREVAQAEANYQAAEQNLILRVSQAYFAVLAAYDTLQADQSALEAIARQLDQANKRFEVGLIAITDVEDAKAARDTAAATVIAQKRTLATTEDQLQEITGQKYDSLAKPGTEMPLRSPEPADQDRWVNISLEQNLSLISSRLAADIARDNVRIAIGGHLPTLDILAGRTYQSQGVDETFGPYGSGLGTVPVTPFNYDTYFNDRQITLQVTVPLFSGGATQSKVRQTQYLWIAAKEAVVQSSRAAERQARDAYLGVISGIARVQALRQAVESNHASLKATEAGYEVGTRTSVDVLNARRNLVQAETDYSTSRYDYLVSVLQLRLAAGNLDRAQLVDINNWLTVSAPTSPAMATPESVAPTIPAPQPAAAPPQPAPPPVTPRRATTPPGGTR